MEVRGQAGNDAKQQRRKKQYEDMGVTKYVRVGKVKSQQQEGHHKGYKIPRNQDDYLVRKEQQDIKEQKEEKNQQNIEDIVLKIYCRNMRIIQE